MARSSPWTAVQRRADLLGADTLRVRNGGVELAVETLGDPTHKPILFLHGFPEHRGAWRKVARHLADAFHCLLPDLRGYGESGRPEETEAYGIDTLIGDVDALVDACGERKPILAGHDWGGALTWWYAARHANRLDRLVIANAPHPAILQHRLIDDAAQRAASAYFDRLRAPDAASRLLENGAESLWNRMFAANPVFDDADRAEYIAAWSRPGAMEAMLNWYRAAPFELLASDDAAAPDWATGSDLMVTIPALILWGMTDRVFLPILLEGLDPLVPDHRIVRFPDAGHAIIHEEAVALAAHIREFATS